MRLRPLVGATTALAALALAGCGSGGAGSGGASPAADDGILTVVASTNVYGSIAQAVGGDAVTVESLIDDPAADPHSYESTPADAATVAAGDIVVYNGGGYDEFMPQLLENAGGEPVVIDVAELSGLVPADAGEPHDEGEAHSEEEHGEFNEHFWYSLPTVQALAQRLAQDLGAADAANAATYTANAEAFSASIDGLIERTEAVGASVPGGRVAVTEPVPGYLVQTAGLIDTTPPEFAEAVEEDTDPPAAVVAQTLALFDATSQDPLRALILNAQTETPTTDQVRAAADAAGVPVVEVTETLPEGTDYLGWMTAQVESLASALNPV
ncbi:zinc ABC transporter substrate-binding protein [Pseudonocardia sp. KRD-184]|uniref:Zinc ABC transporter substrate-binding protein n=1 Tax=Pseudonocardia oceani TaxID=2792013 RepID=A0ABS6UAJ2_9PSEU|nr:zinc ABC transporter substrate-binding protein [Pseudonocardia oceani]MBW0090549.1 zinc ABC transporter substrate-binding protein [Pseudonocardia oceani]MBW0097710.1 zinc ABC transporter substrate-binding protein [Pseudonocardia oceani]MBW0110288.1 zinc ABC transporter substrate-binding protein [Pseudonocardia oceani]MBW0124408.1 zinc ABC transporter substrate-binding protein [Pseudonocardia oceani]MBW0129262.1 zinc ABC transporter substrate-binding protein [Pseudonocardia oceani]